MPMSEPIGIIAGGGQLPLLIARGMRAAGREVCVIGLRGHCSDEILEEADRSTTAGALRIGGWIRACRRFDVREAVLVGKVDKAGMHAPFRLLSNLPDLATMNIWYRRLRDDRRSATLLRAVADALSEKGISLIDSTAYIKEHLAEEGVMTDARPASHLIRDVAFGWGILQQTVELEIGQAISVREGDVVGVEAVEGTDRLIQRTHELCPRGNWTLLKTASSNHDMRTDVPTIGLQTIERMKACGGRCIAVGAGRVILLDRPKVIEAANRAGISIVGIGADGPGVD